MQRRRGKADGHLLQPPSQPIVFICCTPHDENAIFVIARSGAVTFRHLLTSPSSSVHKSDISISSRIQLYYTHTPDVTFIPDDLQKSELDLNTGQEKERQLNLGGEASGRRRQAEFGRGQKNSHVNFLPLSDSVFLGSRLVSNGERGRRWIRVARSPTH
ncbi:hypothetical protein OROGR_026447 [Orobanche gracilis]